MDDYMMYKMLHEMKEGKDRSFVDKFREYMSNSERPSRHKYDDPSWAFMPSKDKSHWDFYMRRDGMPHYGSHPNLNEEYDEDIYKMMRYMKKHQETMPEEDAKYIVSNMHHKEGSRTIKGEHFSCTKAKEVLDKYGSMLHKDVEYPEMYVAINAQYHDYALLFKSWFGDNIDHKIIESAIAFWFNDDDYMHTSKVHEYFKDM